MRLRQTLRTLVTSPGFTLTTVLTLALAIGANSTVFSAIDAVLLEPLPFPEPDRLVELNEMHRDAVGNIAPVRIEDWNRLSATFESISGYETESVAETSTDPPEYLRRARVAPRFNDVWGVEPMLGRFVQRHGLGEAQITVISRAAEHDAFVRLETSLRRHWDAAAAASPVLAQFEVRPVGLAPLQARVAQELVPTLVESFVLTVAIIFGVVNVLVKPVIQILGCPLYIITLGLFGLVVNALLFMLVGWIAGLFNLPFIVEGFWPAFWGAIVVAIVSFVLHLVIPDRIDQR